VSSTSGPSGAVAVLSFHRVVDVPQEGHDVAWLRFVTFFDELAARGTRFRTDLASVDVLSSGVVATFDDGTADHLRVAEELGRRGIGGVFFVSAGRVGTPEMLGVQDLRRMVAMGHVIGSHGIDHVPLDRLPPDAVARELSESKQRLENIVGKAVSSYAFAGGIFTDRALALLPSTGYTVARTMRWGFYRDDRSRWTIPSLPATELTLQRGWISRAIRDGRLPAAMALTGYGKDLIPRDLRKNARRVIGRVLATGRS
jgi:peptidoglycan/xylan/chitin deacetylase (PgdA/CDA1 family)